MIGKFGEKINKSILEIYHGNMPEGAKVHHKKSIVVVKKLSQCFPSCFYKNINCKAKGELCLYET